MGIKTARSVQGDHRHGARGGRPQLQLDDRFIEDLARRGLGCRAIAAEYYKEFSEPVSPATIARRLAEAQQGRPPLGVAV